MQIVQHQLRKISVKILIIIFAITECLPMFRSEDSLSSSTLSSFSEQTFSQLKHSNIQKENLQHVTQTSLFTNKDGDNKNARNDKKSISNKNGRINREGPKIWDHWGNWSGCSVTCGIGKLTRWRHCIGGSCLFGEKKAQLKTCTLAAC
ncbi:THBS2 [Anthophora plagiata]